MAQVFRLGVSIRSGRDPGSLSLALQPEAIVPPGPKDLGHPSDHFRHMVAPYRPRPTAEAYLRLKTLPGEQAQVDWGHFGKLTIGRAARPLLAFVMVLSYSRRIFLRFFLGQQSENFLRGHQATFGAWGGVVRVVLYDNLKSAVLERRGDAIRFNPLLLEFARHYRFAPRPVAVARGNEKGRVERSISYIRRAFFMARRFRGVDDLNRQAQQWCDGPACQRRWVEDDRLTVGEAFEKERPLLLPLPQTPFPTDERRELAVGKTPYVRFDHNDYAPMGGTFSGLLLHFVGRNVQNLSPGPETPIQPADHCPNCCTWATLPPGRGGFAPTMEAGYPPAGGPSISEALRRQQPGRWNKPQRRSRTRGSRRPSPPRDLPERRSKRSAPSHNVDNSGPARRPGWSECRGAKRRPSTAGQSGCAARCIVPAVGRIRRLKARS